MPPVHAFPSDPRALLAVVACWLCSATALSAGDSPIFVEGQGLLAIEAEHFHKQELTDQRAWHITSPERAPAITPDGDPPHLTGASGNAYIEVLPDTRRSHDDRLVPGENFINAGGKMAVLTYRVRVGAPGRYYVWVRAYSTTTEDNGLHFGLDGHWPESGARWQTVKKNGWHWDCKQRTAEVHTGVPLQLWLDIDKPGEHEILMSMREDGIEVDKVVLALNREWQPAGSGPEAKTALRAEPPIVQTASPQVPGYPPRPIVDAQVVFAEIDGLVAVEAEHFYKQSMNGVRAWYLNSPLHRPHVQPDYDDAPFHDAAGLAYVEALPDLFHTDLDPIIAGHNLGTIGGAVAVLHYRVHFQTPGTYYLWTRLRSNDEEDNTTQAGIDGAWPDTAKTLQSPVNKKEWVWKNDNRFSRMPWKITRATLEVPTAGIHDIQFCMREDGEEFDRFILAKDENFTISEGLGPEPKLKAGTLPVPFSLDQTREPAVRRLTNPDGSVYGANVLYKLQDGLLAFEAEDFYLQTLTAQRMWHLVTNNLTPAIGPDSDPSHVAGASNAAYLELLPDARQKDEDAMHSRTSIHRDGGQGAVLTYMVRFEAPGRYFVWVRALATDGDDNTLHVGLDNQWPSSGQKLTFQGQQWGWSNRQRDTKASISLDIPNAGIHQIQISMREDGCELDRLCLTDRADFVPTDDTALPTAIVKGAMENWHRTREARLDAARVYLEHAGAVSIEAESVPATAGWQYFADGKAHSGLGYLEWSPPGQGAKAGAGILKYTFEIQSPGVYQVLLRGRMKDPTNRPDTLDPDGNDIWLKLHGGTTAPGQAALKDDWNKVAILGHPTGWTWNTNLDVLPTHPLSPVCRAFTPGVYSLELSGRSQGYAIDRVMLVRIEQQPIVDFAAQQQRLDATAESRFRLNAAPAASSP